MKSIGAISSAIIAVFAYFQFSQPNEAVKYSDMIVKEQIAIVERTLELVNAIEKREPQEMSEKLKELQEQTTFASNFVSKLEEYQGNSTLRNAALELFEFYEAVSFHEYQMMVEILSKPNQEITATDIEYLQKSGEEIAKREFDLDLKMKFAQQEFAKEFKFEIKSNQYQQKIDALAKK